MRIPLLPITRRRFLQTSTAAAAMLSTGSLGYAWRIEPHWIEVVRRDLPIANLPANLAGRTLCQISDIHVGPIVDDDYIRRTFEAVNALHPDLLAITGDFVTFHGTNPCPKLQRALAHLRPTPLGSFAILGNHDYTETWVNLATAEKIAHCATEAGIRVLRNQAVDVAGLKLIGIDDFWSPRFDPHHVMPHVNPAQPALVLCHNPDAADLPVWGDYQGWILAGHTHGGQCRAPLFSAPIVPVANRNYIAGVYRLPNNRRLYINRGIGYTLRVRFNVRPEITMFTLTRA